MNRTAMTAATALSALAAAYAWGAVGSIISSFPWPGGRNVYRDAGYVYSVASTNTLRAYTASGSLVRTATLAGLAEAGDADHSARGAAYFGVLDGANLMREYVISTGSLAGSFAVSDRSAYAYIPGGAYLYFTGGSYVYRYTTAGSLVNSFAIPYPYVGGVAATRTFRGANGEYVVVVIWAKGSDTDEGRVYTATGSAVANFSIPGTTYGCVCGPGVPSRYGTTLWCNSEAFGGGRWAYQFDLGNGTPVLPTSLGRVKALFR